MDPFCNEQLLNKVREALLHIPNVTEKKMFRGITFMVNDKMCVTVGQGELMCRIDPEDHETALEKTGSREMIHRGKVMKGYIFVNEEGYKRKKDFDYWVKACLDYNHKATKSRKKAK